MGKGAIHPNGTNFRRVARLDVVARVRRLCESSLLKERPQWLEWCERVPPMENHNLHLQARTVRNPYPQMVNFLLKKYPDLRFQDCYVDGNDWSTGNDSYRDDHPVMQFVARQLDFMRHDGLSKKEAFLRTEELFEERRMHLEREQKVMMAMALDSGVSPMFTTGRAYLQQEKARAEMAHLNVIRRQLRDRKVRAEEEHLKQQQQQQQQQRQEEVEGELDEKRLTFKEKRTQERDRLRDEDSSRQKLVGSVKTADVEVLDSIERAADGDDELPTDSQDAAATTQHDAAMKQLFSDETEKEEKEDDESQLPSRFTPPKPTLPIDGTDLIITPRALRKTKDQIGAMLGGSGVFGEDRRAEDSDFNLERKKSSRIQSFDDDDDDLANSPGKR